MKELISKISAQIEAVQADINKTDKQAAGTRARKISLELEKNLKEFRKSSLEASK